MTTTAHTFGFGGFEGRTFGRTGGFGPFGAKDAPTPFGGRRGRRPSGMAQAMANEYPHDEGSPDPGPREHSEGRSRRSARAGGHPEHGGHPDRGHHEHTDGRRGARDERGGRGDGRGGRGDGRGRRGEDERRGGPRFESEHTGFGPGAFGPGGPGFGGFGSGGPGGFGPGGPGFGPGGPGGPGHGRGRRGGKRARRGDVRTAALLLIAEQPRNGYQIIEELAQRTDGGWRPSPGAIYPALAQLEDEGLIVATESAGRKAYQATEAGKTAAKEAADRPAPWAEAAAEAEQTREGSAGALWGSVSQLHLAVQAVQQTGDEKLADTAAQVLTQARTQLYRLLAGDLPTSGGGLGDATENHDDER